MRRSGQLRGRLLKQDSLLLFLFPSKSAAVRAIQQVGTEVVSAAGV